MRRILEKKIAVYGAGARTFCFINFTNISKYIDVILDDQFESKGSLCRVEKYPFCQVVLCMEKALTSYFLELTLKTEEKVINKHEKWVSMGGQFFSILPPSDILLPFWKHFSK